MNLAESEKDLHTRLVQTYTFTFRPLESQIANLPEEIRPSVLSVTETFKAIKASTNDAESQIIQDKEFISALVGLLVKISRAKESLRNK